MVFSVLIFMALKESKLKTYMVLNYVLYEKEEKKVNCAVLLKA